MTTRSTDTVYLVIGRSRYNQPKIMAMRQKKPFLEPGEVAVRLRLDIDSALFESVTPLVVAEIHAGDVIEPTVVVLPAEVEEE
jgi:hypothetical protein